MNSFEIILYITSFNTIFMTLCFIYIYSKEKAYKSNKDLYTKIFTDIDQEIHFIKKSINEHTKEKSKKPTIDEDKIKENMKAKKIKEIDILIGGPPCQAYSVIGRSRMGERVKDDERNWLFRYYIRFLKEFKPKIFVFENVV